MDDEIILRLNPVMGTIKVETRDGGVISHKEITNEQLTECLLGAIKRPAFFSGLLPEGCISFYTADDGSRAVSILHPVRGADITYYKTCYRDFPLPRLVFKFSLHQGLRVQTVSVCVVEDGRLNPESKLFAWPFSNVTDFHMCIGNNVMPKCESLHTLASLPYHILQIPNNDDHYRAIHNKSKMEFRDLLEHLKDKEPAYYYEQVLVPNGRTLKDFIGENERGRLQ